MSLTRKDLADQIIDTYDGPVQGSYGGKHGANDIERYLLVELSTIDGSWHVSDHESVDAAVDYTDEYAEYPEDWTPERLYDLDHEGVTWTPKSAVKRVTTYTQGEVN